MGGAKRNLKSRECWECRGNLSRVWHHVNKRGKLQCHVCFEMSKYKKKVEQDFKAKYSSWNGSRELRKWLYRKSLMKLSTKSKPFPGYKFNCNYLSLVTGSRMVDSVQHEGQIYRRGDLVSLFDDSTRLKYYARVDQILVSSENFGYFGISWLIPKAGYVLSSPFCEDSFDSSYIHPIVVPVDGFELVKAAK